MNTKIQINKCSALRGKAEKLPASKSISNRALIINALAGNTAVLSNLSDANDTQLMMRLITTTDPLIDIEDAGTTMRFLTAYFSTTNQHKTLTGTPRMQKRPIGILVEALRKLGGNIHYEKEDGFPPLKLGGFAYNGTNSLSIQGNISSQFISAIMMVAPILPEGLTINLTGKIGSRPYIEMTAELMRKFGAKCHFEESTITIKPGGYQPANLFVESDWSGASYWFAMAALAETADIELPHLFEQSLQGDSVVEEFMRSLGVETERTNQTLRLKKVNWVNEITLDFTHCPDLGQTIAVVCAAKGIKGYFTGLESLRIKETDRIAALQTELKKIGATLEELDEHHWILHPSTSLPTEVTIDTYEDHRMAMAFAPLATHMQVTINDPQVVRKSYPNYWNDLKLVGFTLTPS